MTNRYQSLNNELDSPAISHLEVTPSDTEDLPFLARALYVQTDGTVAVMARGGSVTYNVVAGQVLPIRAVRVMATGTTADVVAWD